MNYLLTGFVQKDARILMFNPGAEIGNFLNGARYVVSAAPVQWMAFRPVVFRLMRSRC